MMNKRFPVKIFDYVFKTAVVTFRIMWALVFSQVMLSLCFCKDII